MFSFRNKKKDRIIRNAPFLSEALNRLVQSPSKLYKSCKVIILMRNDSKINHYAHEHCKSCDLEMGVKITKTLSSL